MDLRKIADNLGISNYPADLEQATPVDVCDLELIEHIHKEYNIFREHYEDVINGAKALKNDPDRYIWAQYACGYMMGLSLEEAKKFPLPMEEGASDMMPLLIQLPIIPKSVEAYRSRGFDDETIKQMMASYYGCAKGIFNKTGKFGLDLRFHRWMLIYAKSLIFPYMGFNIEVLRFPTGAIFLKNKKDGTVMPLIENEIAHKSGQVLGSAGCEDPEGAWQVSCRETETGWYGYPTADCKISAKEVFFSKEEWDCVLRPDDYVLSIHLPKGMDLSRENVDIAFTTAIEKAKVWYPDQKIRGLYCASWLLDPALADFLGEHSKIVQFGNRFVRHPIKDDGQAVFRFVFPPNITDLNDLPENTSLERGLKNLYLNGGYIYGYRGVIL